MSEHTPLPWVMLPEHPDNPPYSIYSPNGNLGVATDICFRDDAEFIVRACNSHDDLLAALRCIKEQAGERHSASATGLHATDENLDAIESEAEAAITKAELPA